MGDAVCGRHKRRTSWPSSTRPPRADPIGTERSEGGCDTTHSIGETGEIDRSGPRSAAHPVQRPVQRPPFSGPRSAAHHFGLPQ